jgi:hypothetical protein
MDRDQYDEGRFAGYLDPDGRPMSRFLQSDNDDDNESMSLLTKVGLHLVGTAALSAIAHRTGFTRRAARFIDVQVKGTYQAAREILNQEGHVLSDVRADRYSNAMASFLRRRSEIVNERTQKLREFGGLREYDMQRYLRQMNQMIDEQVPFHIEEGLRFRDVMRDINRVLHPDQADRVGRALEKGEFGFLRFHDDQQIRFLLQNGGINDDNVIQLVIQARERYRNFNYRADSNEYNAWVQGMQEKLRQFGAEQIGSITRKEARWKGVTRGHRQATVEDVLAMHSSGMIKIDPLLERQIRDVLGRNAQFGKAVFDENLYVKEVNGQIRDWMDYKSFDQARTKMKEWWANTLPGGLLHLRDQLNIKEAREIASFRLFKRGTVQPMLNAQRGLDVKEPLHEEVIYINGKFVRLFDANAVNNPNAALEILNPHRDMYLTSAKFGTIGKVSRQVGDLMTDDHNPQGFLGKLGKIFDIGKQDKDAALPKSFSAITKFFNDDWERNIINRALSNGVGYDEFFQVRNYFERYTEGLTARTLNNLRSEMPQHLRQFLDDNRIDFSNRDDVLKVFRYFGEGEGRDYASDSIRAMWRKYQRDPDGFLASKRPIGESTLFYGEYTRIQSGFDRINQELGLEMIRQITQVRPRNTSIPFNFRQFINDLETAGSILREDARKAQFLYSFFEFRQAGNQIFSNTPTALSHVNELLTGNTAFRDNLSENIKRTNPIWEKFSGTRPINRIEDDYIAVNRAFNATTLGGRVAEFFTRIPDMARQMSLLTGRRNMEDFTTLSVGSMYPFYRLQDALGNIGLGFSDDSMSSPLKLLSSLMLKRFLPIYVGYEYAQYLDWESEQLTGQSISDRWENYKARRELMEAWENDQSGMTDILKRRRMLHPGIDHFADMPDIYLPGIGEIGFGQLLGGIFAPGTPVDERNAYSAEEYENYLQYGTDPVRKSRWWLFGSKSAYRGDRITEFRPNEYRLALSDWDDTNTDLTGQERWAETNFLPTFRNPFGALAFLIGKNDPYYWEKKHYYDRPYLLTGSMFNPNTMLFGDIGNATIGQLIKPVRRMHPEYWGDPVLVQEEADNLGERPSEPVTTRVSPQGRVENVVMATPTDYGSSFGGKWAGLFSMISKEAVKSIEDESQPYTEEGAPPSARYFVSDELDPKTGEATGAYVAQDIKTGQAIYVPASVAREGHSMDKLFAMAMTEEPSVKTKPRAIFDEEFPYKQAVQWRKLRELNDPRNINWRLQEAWENWTEPLGIYKWLVSDELLGYDPYTGKTVIQKADAANNLSNRFWEMNLGGLGGDLSEIGRRFIRSDDGQLDTYNPIRNTMPDWLPGGDYFINFQTGDPYQKIQHGEYRLPGEAYERLNQLHPDETGRYGAFDKFKILADVAPWSDEYRFWRDYVTQNITDPELRKQAAAIKRQVAQRKKKYEFTPYRFQGAALEYHNVTIRKFLDDYTFLTEEFGDQPFRLAGVDVKPKAEGVLQSYIQVGDKVTIGINADKSKQISDDTYKTAKAVVFKNMENINQTIIFNGEMKENITDFSAPAVFARFTPEEIKKGARWERIAHFESPLNTKFLQVRTALEEYERDQVYGKDWATWENFMISDYLIPGYQSMIRHDFMESVARGAGAGLFIGMLLGGARWAKGGAIVGAISTGIGNLYRQYYEKETGETWIPERRRKEYAINEYFDLLKYMKYHGLYEQAKREAEMMGYDVDAIINEIDLKREINKQQKEELEAEKRRLYIEQPKGWEDRRKQINQELENLSLDWTVQQLPEPILQALQYREKSEETLYGADPYGDRMKLLRAFPYKDRWFAQEFMDAPDSEKERILQLVPENQRRIYKAVWGYGLEEQKPLEYYFTKYYLPDPSWEGWRPEFNLDDIKLKVVRNENLDLSDFNFWPDDVEASQYAPNLNSEGNDIYASDGFTGYRDLQQNIQAVLEGQGLYDVRVTVTPSNTPGTRVQFDYEYDRSDEIENYFRYNMDTLV